MELSAPLVSSVFSRVPIRQLMEPSFGTEQGEIGADRSFTYLLSEEKARQRLWRLLRRQDGLDTASVESVASKPEDNRSQSPPPKLWGSDAGSQAAAPRAPTGVDEEVSVDRGYFMTDQAVQTGKTVELHEQEGVIEAQATEIDELTRTVERLKAAVLGKACAHKEEMNAAFSDFLAVHSAMVDEELDKKNVFETSSLLNLRGIQREREKDSKLAVTLPSPNLYDTGVALLRLSVPETALDPPSAPPALLPVGLPVATSSSAYDPTAHLAPEWPGTAGSEKPKQAERPEEPAQEEHGYHRARLPDEPNRQQLLAGQPVQEDQPDHSAQPEEQSEHRSVQREQPWGRPGRSYQFEQPGQPPAQEEHDHRPDQPRRAELSDQFKQPEVQQPEQPEQQEQPYRSEQPAHPEDTPEQSEQADRSAQREQTGERPEQSYPFEQPEQPEGHFQPSEQSELQEQSYRSEQPEPGEQPVQPEQPEQPEQGEASSRPEHAFE
ncbi:Zinc metalloprotease ZmpB [Diplonema papillatum]|nr:Zinc metalloprotease ZmpB [Diplonema papillatum]